MQATEWVLTAAVILVPLAIAVVVTLWSLKQVRYRPKKWQPPRERRADEAREPVAAGSDRDSAGSR